MKKYPSYKSSNIEWIGEIPEHWEVKRLAYQGQFLKGKGVSRADLTESGVSVILYGDIYTKYNHKVDVIERKTLIETAKNAVPIVKGDLLFTASGETKFDIGKCVVYAGSEEAYASGDVVIFRQNKNDSNFFSYLFNSYYFNIRKAKLSKGEIVVHIYSSQLRNIHFGLPPLPEQTLIAAYLDHKTAQLDTLITKKERLIELLQEERTAIINQAVTKGLDLSVPMKDSGIECLPAGQAGLGEIPEHWEVKKLKYIFYNRNSIRIPLSSEERGSMEVREYDYYGASGVIDKVESYLFEDDNILIGEDGANLLTRSKRLAFIATGKYWVNNHAHIIKPKTGNIDYFCELLEILDYTIWVSGSAQPKLTQEALMNIHLIEPPINEQNLIADFIQSQTTQIDTTITKTLQEIELLKEYKTALISEVVTGKVDVRQEVLN